MFVENNRHGLNKLVLRERRFGKNLPKGSDIELEGRGSVQSGNSFLSHLPWVVVIDTLIFLPIIFYYVPSLPRNGLVLTIFTRDGRLKNGVGDKSKGEGRDNTL